MKHAIRVVVQDGVQYGLAVIGDRKAWHRFRTPDGVKHRTIKAAVAHLRGRALRAALGTLAAAWRCRVSA